jgi:signal transduction histidine kinase/ligand-binding sensor domain-containing protein/CheY-like chemotaxis protein
LTLLGVLLSAAPLPAQRWPFKIYDHHAGLPNLNARALLQDRAGFLWIATDNGLQRYDGKRFRTFTTTDGLPSPQVDALHETPDGTVWAGGLAGLARLQGERFVVVDISPRKAVSSFASDAWGGFYVGAGKGLLAATVAAGRAFSLVPVRGVPDQAVKGIVLTAPGTGWLACGRTILRLSGGRVERVTAAGLPEESWEDLKVDRHGGLWARSRARLVFLAPAGARFESRDEGLPAAATVGRILIARDGQVWVPTIRGLARRTADGWEIFGRSRGLPTGSVRCALEDREGSLWIGMNGAGVARWLGYPYWESWTDAEGLASETVWSILRDHAGVLWASGDAGLSRFDEAARRWVELELPGISGIQSLFLAAAPDGSLWVGRTTGLARIDASRRSVRLYGKEAGFAFSSITSLAVDAGNRVWAGTPNGLYLGTPQGASYRFERQDLKLGQGLDFHYGSLLDRKGRLWCGTWGGLLWYADGKWTRYRQTDGLTASRVAYVVEGKDGSMWVSYMDPVGISQLLPGEGKPRWRHFRKKDGMHSERIFSLTCDARGWIWAGTDRGVDVWDGRAWRHFDRGDGLAWDDCNGHASWADPDGSVWIGTGRALSHVRVPAAGLPARPGDVPVRLLSAEFGGVAAALDRVISVPWAQRSLRAAFTAMSFVNEDSVRFRYRIAGLDDRWTETQTREVHIPALAAGSFSLEVQAAARDGDWYGAPARLGFAVRPAWWRTWWATALALLLAAALARAAWLWRMRSLLHRQRELQAAVLDRTRSLALAKIRAERDCNLMRDQNVEIERLLQDSKQASRLKDQFMANMSHELRTPMNGIIGLTDLTLETELTGEQRGMLHGVKGASRSLLAIIEDVLDLSEAQSGNLQLDTVVFAVEEAVHASLATVAPEARQKGLDLACSIAPGVPGKVVGDPLRLRQVLVNLLSNAVKFTDRGRVSVEVADAPEARGLCLCFTVADTGIGIPKENQTLIFEPFAQADGSVTRRHGGTGLGLTLCARFIDMMGGSIWVESEPGQGSRFHFTVRVGQVAQDAVAAPVAQTPARPAVNPCAAALSILLAEDNPLNQKLAVRLLEKRGHSVVTAMNGSEAVEAFDRQRFDAVLMDLQMPVMGGFEATAEIRARERSRPKRTPIIAVTAHAMQGDRERCLEAGMDDYVAKPIRPDELYAAIDRQVAAHTEG